MSYSYFADYYDLLMEDVDYGTKADYFLELLKRHGHEAGVTLDLACGTGSFIIELKKRNIDVFGADMSEDMLAQAQMKLQESGLHVMLIHSSMQELELPEKIDTCVCTLDSINHIVSKTELVRAFSNISKYLTDNGLFVFDVNTVFKHREILGDNCFILETDSVFCAWQNDYSPDTNEVLITLDFFEPDEDVYVRSSEQFSERAYTHKEMEDMLTSSDLEVIAIYDDMSFEKPKENSQREIYVVMKVIL